MGIVEELKKEFHIEDEWVSFEIHPETPKNGAMLSDLFRGYSREAMLEELNKAGAPYEIKFKNVDFLPNSRLSLLASEYARDNGKFHEFHAKIFRNYFSEGKDIGNINILGDTVKSIGLDPVDMKKAIDDGRYIEKLEKANEDAEQYGINGTPTFIINDKESIVGAQPLERFRRKLQEFI